MKGTVFATVRVMRPQKRGMVHVLRVCVEGVHVELLEWMGSGETNPEKCVVVDIKKCDDACKITLPKEAAAKVRAFLEEMHRRSS